MSEWMEQDGLQDKKNLIQWLNRLFWIMAAGIGVSLISMIPGVSGVTVWLSRAVTAVLIAALFCMRPFNGHYGKAMVFRCVELGAVLANVVITWVNVSKGAEDSYIGVAISLAASICSMIAVYQEYAGHSEICSAIDNRMASKWNGLFLWQILSGVIGGMVSMVVVIIGVLITSDAELLAALALVVVGLVSILFNAIYMSYLRKTMKLLEM